MIGGTTDEYVKANRQGLDSREHRYAFVTEVRMQHGHLAAGDEIEIVFGDQQGGSRGFRRSAASPWDGGAARRRRLGRGRHFTALPRDATGTLAGRAAEPVELTALLPSQLAVGETRMLHLAVLDGWQNAVSAASGTVVLGTVTGAAEYPAWVALRPGTRGCYAFRSPLARTASCA